MEEAPLLGGLSLLCREGGGWGGAGPEWGRGRRVCKAKAVRVTLDGHLPCPIRRPSRLAEEEADREGKWPRPDQTSLDFPSRVWSGA